MRRKTVKRPNLCDYRDDSYGEETGVRERGRQEKGGGSTCKWANATYAEFGLKGKHKHESLEGQDRAAKQDCGMKL